MFKSNMLEILNFFQVIILFIGTLYLFFGWIVVFSISYEIGYIVSFIFISVYFINRILIYKLEKKLYLSDVRFYRNWEGFNYFNPNY